MRCLHRQSGLLAVIVWCSVILAGCGGEAHRHRPAVGQPSPSAATPFRFFSPRSFWNEPIPANASVDPNSARMIAALDAVVRSEVRRKNGPWIDAGTDGVPIVTVTADQPSTSVILDRSGTTNPAISAAWRSVPLPSDAEPSPGEHDLAVWQPSTDRMWEFFEMQHRNGHWMARWGGAMQHVSSNQGVYGPQAWPGGQTYWGVTASSLPLVGGAMTIRQLESGHIDHALALAIPDTRADLFASPAERTDGTSTSPSAVPEGARLRLDPSLDLASLHLPPLTRMIAEAAQRYGIIIRDTGGEVTFFAQEPPRHSDVYAKLYGGLYPFQLLAAFPWSHLQVVKMDLHRGE